MILYPKWFPVAGLTIAPWLIIIRREYKNNISLLSHEHAHAGQMKTDGLLCFWYRYLFSRKWRQYYEVQAYKIQIDNGGSLSLAAQHLSSMYYLGITYEQAVNLLKEKAYVYTN